MVRLTRPLSANEYAVLAQLFSGVLTKPELATRVGLSKPALGELIGRLEAAGIVSEAGESNAPRRGPNARQYAASGTLGTVAGVEIQPGVGTACVADITGALLGEAAYRAGEAASPVELAAGAVREACLRAGMDAAALDVVVVGTPGIVGPAGDIVFVHGHPGWRDGRHRALAEILGCEVLLENDLNLAVLAEHRLGSGAGTESLALVRCGGIGAAFIVNGALLRGAHGCAGELGLAPFSAEPDTRPHPASQEAFQAVLSGLGLEGAPLEDLLADPALHPEANDTVLAEIASRCALVCLTVCAVVDPDRIVLAGPLADAGGGRLLSAVEARIAEVSPLRTEIRASEFGDRAVVAGALLSGLDRLRTAVYGEAAGRIPAPDRLPESWRHPS
ncbi:ROK family protein [Leifsonia sp. McL0607]|uniref:ROK family transcriptional regulator n=1 Tax=Leifsonia sp. McL0607 TaxID=3415672 RepID=UPI003CF435FC